MWIKKFAGGPYATNAYLVVCPKTKKGAVIDPAMGTMTQLLSAAQENGWEIEKILLTHSHWDHFFDAAALQEKLDLSLYVHVLDQGNVENPGSDSIPTPAPVAPARVTGLLRDGDLISVGEIAFEVLHTPGHCRGAVCFYAKQENVLFSGDTLFRGTIGVLTLSTAEPEKMWTSLKRLAELPPSTKVYPGHGAETTIGREQWLSRAREFFGG